MIKATMVDPRDFLPSKYQASNSNVRPQADTVISNNAAQASSRSQTGSTAAWNMLGAQKVDNSFNEPNRPPTAPVANKPSSQTSTQQTKNAFKRSNKNKLAAGLIVFLLAIGVGASAYLAQQNQELRQQASSGVGASCSTTSNTKPFNKKTCDCDGTQVHFDNTGFCGDKSDGESNDEYGSDDGSAKYGLCAVYYKYGCTDAAPPSGTPGQDQYNGCWTCNSNGCSITNRPNCMNNCNVWKWTCSRVTDLSGGCQDGTPSIEKSQSFTAICGAEQIDVECDGQSRDFRSKINDKPCGPTNPPTNPPSEPPTSTPTSTPTTPPTPQLSCANITMLNSNNIEMSGNDDANLRQGDLIRFRASSTDDSNPNLTFEFRLLPPNTSTWIDLTFGTTTIADRNISGPYTIISSGRHVAQARICVSGICQNWEDLSGSVDDDDDDNDGGNAGFFQDVPTTHPNYTAISTLYQAGITGGCSTNPLKYCPGDTANRAAAAIMLMRSKYGKDYSPAEANPPIFSDVGTDKPNRKFMEQMYRDSITSGCATNPLRYCPNDALTRNAAAIMLVRVKHGADYNVIEGTTPIFSDVGTDKPNRKYMEFAYNRGYMPACGQSPLRFCPNQAATRAELAQMIYNAFFTNSSITPPPGDTANRCRFDSDCAAGSFCYQPPMPECPPGRFCPAVMPDSYCRVGSRSDLRSCVYKIGEVSPADKKPISCLTDADCPSNMECIGPKATPSAYPSPSSTLTPAGGINPTGGIPGPTGNPEM